MATTKKRKSKTNMKTKMGSNEVPFLPPEVITDILTRVPIESLLRFRCVCKHWSHQIFDPPFINSHSEKGISENPNFIFLDSSNSNLFFFDINKEEKSKLDANLENDIEEKNDETHVDVLFSCNGLILLTAYSKYFVYNPVTKRSKSVPACEMESVDSDSRLYGMGFDSVSGKYKIVTCGYCEEEGYICKILTVGGVEDECSWRGIDVPKPHHLRVYPPVFANGALHLMMGSMDCENLESDFVIDPESVGKILTLDIGREEFYTITHPECEMGVYTLLETNGVLHFLDHVSNTELKIWALKDLEKVEWKEMYKVDLGHLEGLEKLPFEGFLVDSYPFVMIMNSHCKIIIKSYNAQKDCSKFFVYDIESKELDDELGIDGSWVQYSLEFEQKFYPLKHVNSLVSF